jgi:hypothetical protein
MRRRITSFLVSLFLVSMVAGCVDEHVAVKTVTVEKAASNPPGARSASHARRRHRARRRHTVSASRTFVACDANISVRAATTTCGFAQNAFYEYWTSGESPNIEVYSPATHRTYSTRCTVANGIVRCTTNDRGAVRFAVAAVGRYDQDQADRYASTHDLGDGAQSEAPSAPYGDGGSGAPNDTSGYDGGSDFCDTHDCIPNYPSGNGSTVQCADGTYSHSGGIQGACSHHGGVG